MWDDQFIYKYTHLCRCICLYLCICRIHMYICSRDFLVLKPFAEKIAFNEFSCRIVFYSVVIYKRLYFEEKGTGLVKLIFRCFSIQSMYVSFFRFAFDRRSTICEKFMLNYVKGNVYRSSHLGDMFLFVFLCNFSNKFKLNNHKHF